MPSPFIILSPPPTFYQFFSPKIKAVHCCVNTEAPGADQNKSSNVMFIKIVQTQNKERYKVVLLHLYLLGFIHLQLKGMDVDLQMSEQSDKLKKDLK